MLFAVAKTEVPLGTFSVTCMVDNEKYTLSGVIQSKTRKSVVLTDMYITSPDGPLCFPVLSTRPVEVPILKFPKDAVPDFPYVEDYLGSDPILENELDERVDNITRPEDERGYRPIGDRLQTVRSILDGYQPKKKYLPGIALGSLIGYLNELDPVDLYSAVVRKSRTYYPVNVEAHNDNTVPVLIINPDGSTVRRPMASAELVSLLHKVPAKTYESTHQPSIRINPDDVHCIAVVNPEPEHWNWCDTPHQIVVVLK